jgi:hypothetical protein
MQIIHVAVYEHRHGTDVRAFQSLEVAYAWRTGIAREWWEDEIDDEPPPDDVIGERYFDRMADRGEYFSVHDCSLE